MNYPGGQTREAPIITTGKIGNLKSTVKWNGPFLKGLKLSFLSFLASKEFLLLRVPSGAITIFDLFFIANSPSWFNELIAFSRLDLSIGIIPFCFNNVPTNGILNKLFFPGPLYQNGECRSN